MKKLFALLLAVVLAFCLAACDRKKDASETSSDISEASLPESGESAMSSTVTIASTTTSSVMTTTSRRSTTTTTTTTAKPTSTRLKFSTTTRRPTTTTAKPATTTTTQKPVPMAEAVLGKWTDITYTNATIGLSFQLPFGWSALSDAEILSQNGLGASGDLMAHLETSASVMAMFAHDENNSNVNVIIENLAKSNATSYTEKQYLQVSLQGLETLYEQMGATIESITSKTVQIAGKNYEGIESYVSVNGIRLHQLQFCKKNGTYMVIFTVTGNNASSLQAALNAFSQ